VLARLGEWDKAAADVNRLVNDEEPIFQAGWWVADLPKPDSPTGRLGDPFRADLDQASESPRCKSQPTIPTVAGNLSTNGTGASTCL